MPSARTVDLEQPERFEVVLVPLDDGALGHRRVLDRHQMCSGRSEMTKPPTCCDRWRGKPRSFAGQHEQLAQHAAVGIEAALAHARSASAICRPTTRSDIALS